MIKTLGGFLAVILLTASVVSAQPQKDYKWQVDVTIPDNNPAGVNNIQFVPDDMFGLNTIADVNVDLFIPHTWQGDIIVNLMHGGVTVPLVTRPGVGFAGSAFGFSANDFGNPNVKFILDDEAATQYNPPAVASPGFLGGINPTNGNNRWQPSGPVGAPSFLSAFDGLDKRGEWKLTVSDNAGGDIGVLVNWSLHLQNVPEPTSFMLLGLSGLAFLARRLR